MVRNRFARCVQREREYNDWKKSALSDTAWMWYCRNKPCMARPWYWAERLAVLLRGGSPETVFPCEARGTFSRGVWLRVACLVRQSGQARRIAGGGLGTLGRSAALVSIARDTSVTEFYRHTFSFLNACLLSEHHVRHSAVLPFFKLCCIRLHCMKTSVSTNSSMPFSLASAFALS